MKEFKEILETLKRISDKIEKEERDPLEIFLEEGMEQDAHISIKTKAKGGDNTAEVELKGTNASVIIALAVLEDTILQKIDITEEQFEEIKSYIGSNKITDDKIID